MQKLTTKFTTQCEEEEERGSGVSIERLKMAKGGEDDDDDDVCDHYSVSQINELRGIEMQMEEDEKEY